jgi:23S rRNA pseudouridine2604 synthase
MSEPSADGERLAKRVAALRDCSRAEAERLIEGGWVRVDGALVDDPARRVAHESVEVDPQARPDELRPVTLLWHKPAGVSLAEGQGVEGLVQAGPPLLQHWHLRQLRCVTPLPADGSGLAVFAQGAQTRRQLTEETPWLEQEWMLDIEGTCSDGALRDLEGQTEPLRLGRLAASARLSRNSEREGRTRLRLALKGGQPAALGAWLTGAGLAVRGLHRLRLGRVALGPLAPGEWRLLRPQERF